MAIRDDLILWLDLETTGSTIECDVIEIGLALTNKKLEVIDTFSQVIRPIHPEQLLSLEPVVLDMHTKNGLLNDIIQQKGVYLSEANMLIGDWLYSNIDYKKDKIPFAGSGVLHFDLQFIKRDFPSISRVTTYWAYDVGVMRRILRDFVEVKWDKPAEKSHRALDDVLSHIEELRLFTKFIKEQYYDTLAGYR